MGRARLVDSEKVVEPIDWKSQWPQEAKELLVSGALESDN